MKIKYGLRFRRIISVRFFSFYTFPCPSNFLFFPRRTSKERLLDGQEMNELLHLCLNSNDLFIYLIFSALGPSERFVELGKMSGF